MAEKEKWIFSEGDISNYKYLSKKGNILDPVALRKDAKKTASEMLNDERSYFISKNNRLVITGFRE